MSRTVRLSLALLFALMMVIATASAALAFDPPDKNDASSLCGLNFPALGTANPTGIGPPGGGGGPWNATLVFNPAGVGAIEFGPGPNC